MVRGEVTAARYGFGIERTASGGFLLTDRRASGFVARRFFFYSVREACREFRRELRGVSS